MTDTQRTFIRHMLTQKVLDKEVRDAVYLLLSGKITASADDLKRLIQTLLDAEDSDVVEWKVGGIIQT